MGDPCPGEGLFVQASDLLGTLVPGQARAEKCPEVQNAGMDLLVGHWTFDPFIAVAAALVGLHELGLANLRRRSTPERTRLRRRRSLAYYGGLLLLVLVVASPIDFWADRYFYVHMIQHIFIMFYASLLVVVGAPWIPYLHALPVDARRRVLRGLVLGRKAAPLRALGRLAGAAWTGTVVFCAVMVVWHVPIAFDTGQTNQMIHIWLMHGSMFVAGILFWLQIVPSHPIRPKLGPVGQIGSILLSNLVMLLLAMALSIFSRGSWYGVYAHVPGVSLSPFADQQIGAAMLWVCGDMWAMPALWIILRKLYTDGSLSHLVDRAFHHDTTPLTERAGT